MCSVLISTFRTLYALFINAQANPIKIPSKRFVNNIEMSVIRYIANSPLLKLKMYFAAAISISLYPVYTRIAASAQIGI